MSTTDRPAAFAGRFYPGRRAELEQTLDALVPSVPATTAHGLMLPHAGYVYSGGVAGATVAATVVPPTVVVLGPKHTWAGASAAINRRGRWQLPTGEVPIAEDLADAVADALPFLHDDDAAFAGEHSLEVELPFLQARQPDLRIVPIVFGGRLSPEQCTDVGRTLAQVVDGWPDEVLLVASTDMHHQGEDDLPPGATTWDEVRRRSARALEHVDAMDPQALLRRCRDENITMCGVQPTAVTMAACEALGATTAEPVQITDSYAVRPGDGRYTVGYAGYRFTG